MSHSNEPHDVHAGRGGWRSTPQFVQRWMSSSPRLAPSKKKALSWVRDGRGRNAAGALGCTVWGRKRRMRKRMVATRSPCWSVNSRRVVTKCPTPSPVCFSGETESMIEDTVSRSPSTRGRVYSWSQLVATTEVKPASLNTSNISSCAEAPPEASFGACQLPPGCER